MLPKDGFWKQSNLSTEIYACLNPSACIQPETDSGDYSKCADGYNSNLCAGCDWGYYHNGIGRCAPCMDEATNYALMTLGWVLVSCLIAFIIRNTIKNSLNTKPGMSLHIKIMLNYLNAMIIFTSMNVDWPVHIRRYLEVMSTLGNS